MHKMIYRNLVPILLGLLFLPLLSAFGQDFVVMNRCLIWETFQKNGLIGAGMNSSANYPTPRWQYPGRPVLYTGERRDNSTGGGIWIGAKNVTDIGGVVNPFYVSEIGIKAVDPALILEKTPLQIINNFGLKDAATLALYPAEQNVVIELVTDIGVTVKRTAMAWSYPDYDDFIVLDYRITNNGDMDGDGVADQTQTLEDLYVAFVYGIVPNMYGHNLVEGPLSGAGWNYAPSQLTQYNIEHNMLFAHDYWEGNTAGNPHPATGELLTPEVAALKMVYMDPNDNGTTIASNVEGTFSGEVKTVKMGFDVLYDLMSIDRNDKEGPIGHNSFQYLTYGPYTLDPGEELHIVAAHANGSISKEDALTGDASLLPASYDSLLANIEHLIFLFNHDFNVPDPPPAPELYPHVITPGHLTVSWSNTPETYEDPDYTGAEAQDFDGYRVYRSSISLDGPWEMLFECSDTQGNLVNEYTDIDGKAGYGYFYTVTSFDKGHNDWDGWLPEDGSDTTVPPQESGKTNRNTEPTYITRTASNSLDVRVVPNPFRGRANWVTEETENQLMFTNLPGRATIKVYTVTGDLIKTLEHTDGSGTEYWPDQRSDSNQYVKSGVYLFTVESDVGSSAGKFVIIR